jgi:hypothetical protein
MRADIVRALRPADERARLLAQRGDDPGMDKRMRISLPVRVRVAWFPALADALRP